MRTHPSHHLAHVKLRISISKTWGLIHHATILEENSLPPHLGREQLWELSHVMPGNFFHQPTFIKI